LHSFGLEDEEISEFENSEVRWSGPGSVGFLGAIIELLFSKPRLPIQRLEDLEVFLMNRSCFLLAASLVED
jgi:hypothetical protein